MSYKYNRPKARKGHRVEDVRSASEALKLALVRLEERSRHGGHGQLRELWRNWKMVMGEDLAYMALPLGQRKDVLLVGAEDHLVMHELSFSTLEILERANAFMDEEFFRKVELHLLMGQEVLDQPANITPSTRVRLPVEKPGGLDGSFASRPGLNSDSPVVRCYVAYLRLHGLA